MEPLLEFGLEATLWLQTNFPQLAGPMAFISAIGEFEFYLLIIPLIYWSIDKRQGKFLGYLLTITALVVAIGQHAFRGPRPYWIEEQLGLSEEEHYGIPSGHTQTVTVAYLFLASCVRRRWAWLLALLMIFAMALSRVYLGVHFVHDVAAGFGLGLLILLFFALWMRSLHQSFQNRILGQRLLAVLVAPILFAVVYIVLRVLAGPPAANLPWAEHVATAELAAVEDVVTYLGILFGLGIGFIMEASLVHFITPAPLKKKVIRYLLGMAATILIWRGLGSIFPADPLWIGLPLRFFRYLLAGLWVAYYGPQLFVRLGLAEASPEPEVSLKVSDQSIMRG